MQSSSMLNTLSIEGSLNSEVNLRYDLAKKTHIAKFYLKNTTRIGQNVYQNDFYIVVYGTKAELCYKELHMGDRCLISGKISMWHKSDRNGNQQPGVTVIASDVFLKVGEPL